MTVDILKERVVFMSGILSFALAAMSGICFVGGIAILSGGKER